MLILLPFYPQNLVKTDLFLALNLLDLPTQVMILLFKVITLLDSQRLAVTMKTNLLIN